MISRNRCWPRSRAARIPSSPGLATRADDDFSIALLDAVATVGDVLTFYQERIANESFLRTATERVSVLELARLIGYELKPGVAASTLLAFTVDDAVGSPGVGNGRRRRQSPERAWARRKATDVRDGREDRCARRMERR
jgi:hypothetical protein